MRAFRNASIRTKLWLITLGASSVALVAACIAFSAFAFFGQSRQLAAKHEVLAEVIGSNSKSAVVFDDPQVAKTTLTALEAEPHVVEAGIYTPAGSLLASYTRNGGAPAGLSQALRRDGTRVAGGEMISVRGIFLDGERIGTIYLRSDLGERRALVARSAWITLVVLLGCSLIVLAAGGVLHRPISRPVMGLVEATRRFSVDENYDTRATKFGDDELGDLVDAFNDMLDRIRSDMELETHKRRLEEEVAHRSRLNRDLQLQKDRAEAAARAKSAFLANMSHEIRTPMTAILGYVDLLCDPTESGIDRADCAETIRRNGRHLLAIINDILDLSKIEAGMLAIERIRTSTGELVRDVEELMRMRAAERGLEFSVGYASPVPEFMFTDPTRLRQILVNLLGNAIKFTERGSVRLIAGMEEPAPDLPPRLRFDVVDTGIGLREQQLASIFDPFEQADRSTTRHFGGTGLGLAISNQLAQMLDGDITVQSVLGRGSTFTLTIAVGSLEGVTMLDGLGSATSSGARPLAAAATSSPGRDLRVLVADDGPDNQRLIRAFLEGEGFRVEVVSDGRSAVDRVSAAAELDEPFDAVLMDMHMPEMDGYEATRTLRAQGYGGLIVALTARAMRGDREQCLAAGCNAYLTKPIDRARLVSHLLEELTKCRD